MSGRNSILRPVSLSGIGLHLGVACELTFRPAAAGSGVRFVRTDLPGAPSTPALVSVAVETERRTQLGSGEGAIHTVEHVLAAVAALEIDDLIIELNAPEPPIMDGSAGAFFRAMREAGIADLCGRVDLLTISKSIRVEDGESWYEAHPASELTLEVSIDFPHSLVGRQTGSYRGDAG